MISSGVTVIGCYVIGNWTCFSFLKTCSPPIQLLVWTLAEVHIHTRFKPATPRQLEQRKVHGWEVKRLQDTGISPVSSYIAPKIVYSCIIFHFTLTLNSTDLNSASIYLQIRHKFPVCSHLHSCVRQNVMSIFRSLKWLLFRVFFSYKQSATIKKKPYQIKLFAKLGFVVWWFILLFLSTNAAAACWDISGENQFSYHLKWFTWKKNLCVGCQSLMTLVFSNHQSRNPLCCTYNVSIDNSLNRTWQAVGKWEQSEYTSAFHWKKHKSYFEMKRSESWHVPSVTSCRFFDCEGGFLILHCGCRLLWSLAEGSATKEPLSLIPFDLASI